MDVQAQPTPEAPPPQTSPSAPLHYAPPAAPPAPNFIAHAKLIGAFTLLSRLLGMAREVIAARFFGAGVVWSAFQYAFTIPNLFRKLLGEGALSAAFIPLYAKALKDEQTPGDANNFAAASVSLLISILIGITLIGEAILVAVLFLADLEPGTLLAVKLTVLMLPYVVFVCAAAFVGGILQVHRRFTAPAVIPVVSNLLMIVALAAVALTYDLTSDAGQTAAVWWVAIAVLVSGVVQLIVLWPALRTVGFRFRFVGHFWTPAVKKMLLLSIPVALGAGVLQIGVVVDKQIALLLAPQSATHTTFEFFGQTVPLPMESGALARLNWAQFLYQFPLGVFAISLATAIFPQLSGDALDADRTTFRNITRRGLEASLFIGLPASVGMAVVATPAVRLLFEGGQFTAHDSLLTARSTAIYASAIWAFSILQVLNRAFYALHDMRTPLIAAALNLLVNLIVEIPLLWTPLGESAMAAGTAVSFALQALFMLWLLRRRLGPLGLSRSLAPITKMLIATAAMGLACWLLTTLPAYTLPWLTRDKLRWALQLAALMTLGGGVYMLACMAMGIDVLAHVRRRKK